MDFNGNQNNKLIILNQTKCVNFSPPDFYGEQPSVYFHYIIDFWPNACECGVIVFSWTDIILQKYYDTGKLP